MPFSAIKARIGRLANQLFPRSYYAFLIRQGKHIEPELQISRFFCAHEESVVDVGANAGLYSYYLAGFAKQVLAFEPNPSLHRRLARVLPRNVTLHKVGLSDREYAAMLRFDPANTGIGTIEAANRLDDNPGIKRIESVEVPIKQLDAIVSGPVSFMKIDVEGHEESVLRGATRLLARWKPSLLIEIEERHRPDALSRVPTLLNEFGYDCFYLQDGKLVRLGQENTPIQRTAELYAGREYINNFFFVHPDRLHQLPMVEAMISP